MSSPGSPTVRRRRLAAELKRLREAHGMTADLAARQVGISKSSLSRIENALVSVLPPVVRALLELYGVGEDDIDALVQVARDARKRGWWQKYDDVLPSWFSVYVGLEAEAAEIKGFEPQLVPGLLQTSEYARAVIRAEHPDAPDAEVERRVELRLRRQDREQPPRLWYVLDEAVLHRPVGGRAVMRRQLDRILKIASLPGNTVQVLPFDLGEHASMGSAFSVLTFRESADPPVGYVETRAGSLYLEGQQVEDYAAVFRHLCATARGARESAVMITDAMARFGEDGAG